MIEPKKKVAFYTLGCKLNFAETSTISRVFTNQNISIVKFNEFADYYVVNTCSVTSNADKKSRNAISRAIHLNPQATVIITGCYAELKSEEIKKIFNIENVIVIKNKNDIESFLISDFSNFELYNKGEMFFSAYSKGDRTRSFLKVQDGCDYFCNYCTIPLARGRSRNVSIGEIIVQAKNIVNDGVKEIILTGVNIGDFGKTTGESFFDLIKSLTAVNGIERLRISSIEPNLLSYEMIEYIAENEKIMPHFHIPLQSGCDEVLKMMNRHYDTKFFRYKIEKIKQCIPNAFIGIDLIIGLNGETEEYFQETLQFVESLDISFIHHFQYSERANTKALKFEPKVTPQEKQRRSKLINDISDKKHYNFLKQNIGVEHSVLFESTKKNSKMYGYTENYIRVERDYVENLINKIVKVKLTKETIDLKK